ncbi:ATP-binding protein [Streptomyces sp. TG1A-8]|uniref:ATP-binding protein n=1 Tax=Streptomyces sp. TG1A-8 TaxID=3051385 RepID=UPI00265B7964|nr:ATP-binding protein [Streptomyces sp. TG1A-8]MDO0926072.1 ATP-binding protein [Streptomyces sp. TG1A-8]
MKQSAAKTLGVAALGAAFAAAGAGAANAAPAAPDAAQALDTVTRTLPSEKVVEVLSGTETLNRVEPVAERGVVAAQPVVAKGVATVVPTAESALAHGRVTPVTGLLGGLPVQGLPTRGVSVNGVSLG